MVQISFNCVGELLSINEVSSDRERTIVRPLNWIASRRAGHLSYINHHKSND